MKVTINITGPQGPVLPSNIQPMNAIFSSALLYEYTPTAIRNEGYRPLNAFDVYYDLDVFHLLPTCIGIEIDGLYNILGGGAYSQITNTLGSPLGDAHQPLDSGAPGFIDGFYTFDDLGYSLDVARTIYIYDKPIVNGVVLQYYLIDEYYNPLPNICTLYIFSNSEPMRVSTYLTDAQIVINNGGVMPLIFNDSNIDMFGMKKQETTSVMYNHNTRFTPEALQYINQIFPNLAYNYPPKIVFIKESPLLTDFEYEVTSQEYVMDGLLKCNGNPIYYGQSIHTDKTVDGSLTFDTTTLAPGTIHIAYVTVEGMQSGKLLYGPT